MAKFFRDSEDTVTMLAVDYFTGHSGGTFTRIHISTSRAETGMAAKRDKFKMAAVRTAIHGSAERSITAVNHLINVFYFCCPWMESIYDYFVVISKDFLNDIHEISLLLNGAKWNPTPS
jgi:hypothetical protein